MLKRLAAAGLLCLACGVASSSAHHAQEADYLKATETVVEGVVARVIYKNPHSFVYVMTAGRDGPARVWAVECGAKARMTSGAVEHQLRPGDAVIVTGSPGRDPSAGRLLMKQILRPRDGRRWSSRTR
jgi:hypothetical protein